MNMCIQLSHNLLFLINEAAPHLLQANTATVYVRVYYVQLSNLTPIISYPV